jgi:protein-L-isoaspartate(D-aspartate) O-methyltransferase
MASDQLSALREEMIRIQLERRGIDDSLVLSAMRSVPRHLFFPPSNTLIAYDDAPAPIGFGQTISQPYMVALMTSLLQVSPTDTILEIGTGSGYQAAILSRLAAKVISLEIIPQLAERASKLLHQLKYDNIEVICQDGSGGYPAKQPYQGILVTACAPSTPEPLLDQLDANARLILPVAEASYQVLRIWQRSETGGLTYDDHISVAFVPLRGEFGFPVHT